MYNPFNRIALFAATAFALLIATGPAHADNVTTSGSTTVSGTTSSDDSQIALLRKIATQGQSADITAQVNDFIDQNKDSISALMKSCEDYLSGLKSSLNKDDAPSADTSSAPASPAPAAQTVAQTATPDSSTPALQSGALQPSSGLQSSSGLRTNHLAGYPSLPATDPTSSLQKLTAEQTEYAIRVQKIMQAQKAYLMTHPAGYSY